MIQEHVPLAPHTTFKIGGAARFFASVSDLREAEDAVAYAALHQVPVRVLGGGSNVLVSDMGVDALVLAYGAKQISFVPHGDTVHVVADAGAPWDELVSAASARGLWGTENLADIPGTVGGALVQNIGAYGAELKDIFVEAEVLHLPSSTQRVITKNEAGFGYRTSLFKKQPEFLIMRATLALAPLGMPQLSYPDLVKANERGEVLRTPTEIAEAVRRIRRGKFPNLDEEGTAGSFFKNPIVSAEQAARLTEQFPELRQFPHKDGLVKVSLAWILDHVLHLNGFAMGHARLFERQPLVIATSFGATAEEVENLGAEIAKRVFDATGIAIEREVESFKLK
ncbi:MAG TPA: UDP-N-acetylmuramate dehydrogenase [Candidatus Paceibacterota bacterium]|nr:UDP-N-acetylmuramate dehydrogenase [Candidatus Paceibacterota bacterium]